MRKESQENETACFLAIGTIVLCAGLLAGCGKITKSVEINYGETYKIEDEN